MPPHILYGLVTLIVMCIWFMLNFFEIKNVNGVYRYYTKGDANKNIDDGYVTEDKIYALVKLKVKYIGYPTLWVRELFS